MATAKYSAELRARKYTSTSNFKASAASQEFYDSSYNLVGIISFTGMNLANKVISSISLTMTSTKAGFGAGHTKTVFLRKAVYQNASTDVTGGQYVGDALGTFDGSFYDNTTSYTMSGTLLTNMANYIAAGNNTFTIYNPIPRLIRMDNTTFNGQMSRSYHPYGRCIGLTTSNYGQSGSAVTIYTNRVNTPAHTVTYAWRCFHHWHECGCFRSWTPALHWSQIPNATGMYDFLLYLLWRYTYGYFILYDNPECWIETNFTLGVRSNMIYTASRLLCCTRVCS